MEGKIALVTGGGLGIGAAIGEALARAGAAVALVGRTLSRCEAVAGRIIADGGRAIALEADVGFSLQCEAAVRRTVEEFGRLDILVNNAGVVHAGGFEQTDDTTWAAVWGASVTGTFACTRAALPHFRAQRTGHVINIASQAAGWPGWNEVAYGTAKAAQVKLTLHLLDQFRQWGKEADGRWFAHVVCPGGVDTRIHEKVKDKSKLLSAEDVADLCLELLKQGEHGLTELEKRCTGKPYAVGPVGIFERHEAIIRIWKNTR